MIKIYLVLGFFALCSYGVNGYGTYPSHKRKFIVTRTEVPEQPDEPQRHGISLDAFLNENKNGELDVDRAIDEIIMDSEVVKDDIMNVVSVKELGAGGFKGEQNVDEMIGTKFASGGGAIHAGANKIPSQDGVHFGASIGGNSAAHNTLVSNEANSGQAAVQTEVIKEAQEGSALGSGAFSGSSSSGTNFQNIHASSAGLTEYFNGQGGLSGNHHQNNRIPFGGSNAQSVSLSGVISTNHQGGIPFGGGRGFNGIISSVPNQGGIVQSELSTQFGSGISPSQFETNSASHIQGFSADGGVIQTDITQLSSSGSGNREVTFGGLGGIVKSESALAGDGIGVSENHGQGQIPGGGIGAGGISVVGGIGASGIGRGGIGPGGIGAGGIGAGGIGPGGIGPSGIGPGNIGAGGVGRGGIGAGGIGAGGIGAGGIGPGNIGAGGIGASGVGGGGIGAGGIGRGGIGPGGIGAGGIGAGGIGHGGISPGNIGAGGIGAGGSQHISKSGIGSGLINDNHGQGLTPGGGGIGGRIPNSGVINGNQGQIPASGAGIGISGHIPNGGVINGNHGQGQIPTGGGIGIGGHISNGGVHSGNQGGIGVGLNGHIPSGGVINGNHGQGQIPTGGSIGVGGHIPNVGVHSGNQGGIGVGLNGHIPSGGVINGNHGQGQIPVGGGAGIGVGGHIPNGGVHSGNQGGIGVGLNGHIPSGGVLNNNHGQGQIPTGGGVGVGGNGHIPMGEVLHNQGQIPVGGNVGGHGGMGGVFNGNRGQGQIPEGGLGFGITLTGHGFGNGERKHGILYEDEHGDGYFGRGEYGHGYGHHYPHHKYPYNHHHRDYNPDYEYDDDDDEPYHSYHENHKRHHHHGY